jgi:hypothetical protein
MLSLARIAWRWRVNDIRGAGLGSRVRVRSWLVFPFASIRPLGRIVHMATLTVNLADELKAHAISKAVAAGYASVDEYIASLIEGDELPQIDAELESKLLAGLDSGPSIPLTRELLDDIKRRARGE